MRDCAFLLADTNMQAAFEGFFSRPGFYKSLGCGEFDFNPRLDIKVAAGDNDPGLYTRGHELLRTFHPSHRRAVMVLDAEWEGSPGAEAIKEHITQQIQTTEWENGTFQVIVIDPELENWIWQRNDHVARGLGFDSMQALMEDPDVQRSWPKESQKPTQPKEILEKLLRKRRIPRSSAIYKRITSQVSVRNCQDNSFLALSAALKAWFPPEAE